MNHPPPGGAKNNSFDPYETLGLCPHPVFVVDPEGAILFANAAAAGRLGAPAETLVGRSCFSLMTEEVRARRRRLFDELRSDLSPRHDTGVEGTRYSSCWLKPLLDEHQRLQAVAFYYNAGADGEAGIEDTGRYNTLLDMIRRAQDAFITRTDHESVFNDILHLLIEASASSYGFLDEVLYSAEGQPFKLNLAMSNISWDQASRDLYDQLKNRQLEFHDLDNLAGLPVTEARLIIANDLPDHPAYKGLPPGHPPLHTYLGIPLFSGAKVIGVIGLANRPGGYSEAVVERLEPLINTCTTLIRSEQQTRRDLENQGKLRASEEKYRRIVETTNEGILMLDADHQIIFVNHRLAAMLGRSCEEMLNQPIEHFVFPADREAQRSEMALRAKGRENRYERRFVHKDGHLVWGLVSGMPLLDERGVFRGSFGLIADISELKAVEQELRRSEDQFRKIFEVASVGIVQVDPREGRIVNCNDTFCLITGYSYGELLSIDFPDLTHPEDRESDWRIFSQAARGETPNYLNEKRYIRKDGAVIWVRLNAAFIRDAQGRPLKTVAVCEDITEIRRVSAELMQERDRLRGYLETAQAIIVALDATGQVRMINRYGLRLLGYAHEADIIGRNWFRTALPQPQGWETVFPVFQQIMSGELAQVEYFENEVITTGGELRLIHWRNTSLTDEQGQVCGTLSTGVDLTEQKQRDELISQLRKTESLACMAGAVAHKFNNYLAAVLGNLEMLLDDLAPDSGPHKQAEAAMQAGQQAAEISTAMMAYLGQTISRREHLDLAAFCWSELPGLLRELPPSVKTETGFSSGPLPIRVDAGQLRQVIRQVLANAVEALPAEQGIVRVTCDRAFAADIPGPGRCPADWQPGGEAYACLAIADTGGGIAREDMGKLFDPFFSRKFTGRGLGLPLLLGFVRSHGGVVTVESEVGRGSVFRIYLPIIADAR